ncbi:MAG: hypothetical protein ABI461_05055 [Polyangiaceae bacterium]
MFDFWYELERTTFFTSSRMRYPDFTKSVVSAASIASSSGVVARPRKEEVTRSTAQLANSGDLVMSAPAPAGASSACSGDP